LLGIFNFGGGVNVVIPLTLEAVWPGIWLTLLLLPTGYYFLNALFGRNEQVGMFFWFFGIRLILSVFLWGVFQFDDEIGMWIVLQSNWVTMTKSFVNGAGYYSLVYWITQLLGEGFFVPKVLNSFLGSLLPYFVQDLAIRIGLDRRVATRAFFACGLLPPLLIFSSVYLKEVPTALLLIVGAWSLWGIKPPALRYFCFALTCLFLYWWRGMQWLVVLAFAFVVDVNVLAFSYRRLYTGRSPLVKGLIIFVALLVSVFVCVEVVPAISNMIWVNVTSSFTRYLRGGAAYKQFLDLRDVFSFWNLGLYLFRGMFSPAPLRFIFDKTLDTYIEAFSTATWYAVVPFLFIGASRLWRSRVGLGCLIITSIVFATSSIEVLGGDPYRHRIALFPFAFLFAAEGWVHYKYSPRYRYVVWGWGVCVVAFTFFWATLRMRGGGV